MKNPEVLPESMWLRVSELTMLSSDPEITFRPDPGFRTKFRNADETYDGDLEQTEAGPQSVCRSRSSCSGSMSGH
jgi:hypothetical protein